MDRPREPLLRGPAIIQGSGSRRGETWIESGYASKVERYADELEVDCERQRRFLAEFFYG